MIQIRKSGKAGGVRFRYQEDARRLALIRLARQLLISNASLFSSNWLTNEAAQEASYRVGELESGVGHPLTIPGLNRHPGGGAGDDDDTIVPLRV